MVIFPFPQFKYLTKSLNKLPDKRLGKFKIGRFPNWEIFVRLETNVKDQNCLILGSISPPDDNLIALLFLAHTLKKEGASRITALMPYLSYARQDREKKGESLAAATVGELLRSSHVNEVVAIDLHSPKVEGLFPLQVQSLSPAKVFSKEIEKLNLKNPTLVAPDEGAIERTLAVSNELKIKTPLTYIKKTRSGLGVEARIVGKVTREVVVIDDILDTGGTLLACCRELKALGAKKIYIFVTHGLFTGTNWRKLFPLNVQRIYCTDSNPEVKGLSDKRITILSVAPILKDYARHIKKIHRQSDQAIKKMKKDRGEEPFLHEEIA